MTSKKITTWLAAAGVTALAATSAHALQRGAPQYPTGVDTLYAADYPPIPGVFMFAYGLHYNIDNIRDGQGRKVFNGFRGNVTGLALKPTIVWDTTIFGARPVTFVVLPFLHRNLSADSVNTFAPPGAPVPPQLPFSLINNGKNGQQNFGLSDITISQNLNWKLGNGWSVNLGFDIWAPTGDYKKDRFFNVGSTNSWSFYPSLAVTWRSPQNHHLSFKAQYGFSTKNAQTATDAFTNFGQSIANYQSGQHWIFEGAAGIGITENIGLDITGFALIQTTPDKSNGIAIADSKTQKFGLGPQLRINVGPGAIAIKYQKEFDVKNAPQGDRFWIQAGIPLWVPNAPAAAKPVVAKGF
jgi:hypothetical protein